MTRLVTFGCSHTFGHGLPDCIVDNNFPGLYPSKLAWPSLLATKLNYDLYNGAMPGMSNFAILDIIINFKLQPDDLVIVLWSYFERDMIFQKNGQRHHFRIGKSNTLFFKKIIDSWLDIHNETDIRMRSWYYMHHAHLYLKSTVKNYYFLHVNNEKTFWDLQPNFGKEINFLPVYFGELLEKYPRAGDGKHGGAECHTEFANQLFEEITKPKIV